MTTSRELLRHTLATLAYRAGKTLRDAPDGFAAYKASATTRTPAEILAHVGDLLDWMLHLAEGRKSWKDSAPLTWAEEVARFHKALAQVDHRLASALPLHTPVEVLFQGPVADALTHVGQIALLRRMFGAPVRGESYVKAEIVTGRVGPEQAPPRAEFG